MQIGAGIMGIPQILFIQAKGSAWISVLLTGILLHLTVFIMVKLLQQYENADLFMIQKKLFGKWISLLLGTIYLSYLFLVVSSIILTYIEVVQVYIFPDIPNYQLSFLLIALAVYAINGGFRVAVGTSFIFFFVSSFMMLLLIKPITLIEWVHYLPIIQAPLRDILMGAYQTSYTVIGLEILLFIYPFIINKRKIAVAAHSAVFYTTFILFFVTFVSIGYFSGPQLENQIWPTLSMFKIVTSPIIERFDFLAVAFWIFIILPNIILFTWLISYGAKRLYHVKQKHALYVLAFLLYLVVSIVYDRTMIRNLSTSAGNIGFYIVFVYPWILYLLIVIKKKMQQLKGRNTP